MDSDGLLHPPHTVPEPAVNRRPFPDKVGPTTQTTCLQIILTPLGWRVDMWMGGRHASGLDTWKWAPPCDGECVGWTRKMEIASSHMIYPCRPLIIIHFQKICCQITPNHVFIFAYATDSLFFGDFISL